MYLWSILTFTVGTRKATRTVTFISRWWDQWQTCTTMMTWIRLAWIIKDWMEKSEAWNKIILHWIFEKRTFFKPIIPLLLNRIYFDNDLQKLKLWALHHFRKDSKHQNIKSKKTIYCRVKNASKRIHGNVICIQRFIQNM